MQRPSADATLLGVDRSSLKTGSDANRIRLIAESLPAQITPADLDFGTGVKVRRIVSHSPNEIIAEVDVAADAVSGKRDIASEHSVDGAHLRQIRMHALNGIHGAEQRRAYKSDMPGDTGFENAFDPVHENLHVKSPLGRRLPAADKKC